MTRPESVKIGAHRYTVQYDELVYDRGEQAAYNGTITYNKGLIQIMDDGERSPGSMAETFLHEVVHGISTDRALEMSERQVDQLAAGLLAVMVDNPDLFGAGFVDQWGRDAE